MYFINVILFFTVILSSCKYRSIENSRNQIRVPFQYQLTKLNEPVQIKKISHDSNDAIYRFVCGNSYLDNYICITFYISDLFQEKGKIKVVYKELFNDKKYEYELPNSIGGDIFYSIMDKLYHDEIFSLPRNIEDTELMVSLFTDADQVYLERLNKKGYRDILRTGNMGPPYLITKDIISKVNKYLPNRNFNKTKN
jgi:hypothetical protein